MIKAINKNFDSFLQKHNIDKATLIAYVFTLLTIFVLINRIYEVFYTIITGVASSYWHPILYALALICPAIAFAYACSSKFAKTLGHKVKFAVWAGSSFYLIIFTMLIQWCNKLIWMILVKVPSFAYVIANMPETILPAIRYGTIILPIFTIPIFIGWYINSIKHDVLYTGAIEDYEGKIPTTQYIPTGPYTCEVELCKDVKTDRMVKTPEKRRYEATLIQGATGTGKTATMIEPMCACDIEKKFFFLEESKKLGYEALKSGFATLGRPLTNEFLNDNFTLDYLVPVEKHFDEYVDLMKNMILYIDPDTHKIFYKTLGLTLIAPDAECIGRIRDVAKNYNINVNYIDPLDPNSLGMNPFILEDPAQVAIIISTVLKGMYESENAGESNVFFANVTQQALENLTILLKVMYPKMNNGAMPTLEDMLKMLYDFNLVEQTCEEMKKDPVLFEEYKVLIGYFERNFYKPPVNINGFEIPGIIGSGRKDTEKFIYGTITQLDNLLRHPGVKNVICSRERNVALDEILEKGGVITVCTQKGTLANILSKAFGMFFILAFQYAVLRRPGREENRVPHFLYIDEFPDFINKETETCFTQFRKYRCGMVIAIQNLSQLQRTQSMKFYREVVLTNTKTQIIFGDTNIEDSQYWESTLGIKEIWVWGTSWNPTKSPNDDGSSNMGGIQQIDKKNFKATKLQGLGFKKCAFKTKDATGKTKVGTGLTDFLAEKHKKPHTSKYYNYEPFLSSGFNSSEFFTGDDSTAFRNTISDNGAEYVDIINDDVTGKPNDINNINSTNIEVNIPTFDDNNDFTIIFDDGAGNVKSIDNETNRPTAKKRGRKPKAANSPIKDILGDTNDNPIKINNKK